MKKTTFASHSSSILFWNPFPEEVSHLVSDFPPASPRGKLSRGTVSKRWEERWGIKPFSLPEVWGRERRPHVGGEQTTSFASQRGREVRRRKGKIQTLTILLEWNMPKVLLLWEKTSGFDPLNYCQLVGKQDGSQREEIMENLWRRWRTEALKFLRNSLLLGLFTGKSNF